MWNSGTKWNMLANKGKNVEQMWNNVEQSGTSGTSGTCSTLCSTKFDYLSSMFHCSTFFKFYI